MPLQHIQSEQTIHILIPQPGLAVHHGDGAGEVVSSNGQFHHVNFAQYLPGANADGRSGEAIVDEVQQPQSIRARAAHDGALRSRVDKDLERLFVREAVHVQHEDASHALGIFFHHLFVLTLHVLEPYLIAKVFVGLFVHGVELEFGSHFDLLGLCEVTFEEACGGGFHHGLSPYFRHFVNVAVGCHELFAHLWIVIVQFFE
mmetsp:Transcript_5514/g.11985  ORF Transcript_5514/g.11985 Transcript_5514/m.11985 type:complete len:202 (-) Transcript_5514:299-904(-)